MITLNTALSSSVRLRYSGNNNLPHGSPCACNVCARSVSQPSQPSYLVDPGQLQKNPQVQQAVAALPYSIDTKEVPSIFKPELLKPIPLNNPDLIECVDDLADILKEAKKQKWTVEAFANIQTGDYLVVVDKFGLHSSAERINLIREQDDQVGRSISRDQEAVTDHELMHASLLRLNPYVQVNKVKQALKIVIGGSNHAPSLEGSQWYKEKSQPSLMKRTYGMTVYTQYPAFQEYDNVEAQFQNSVQNYTTVKQQGFQAKDEQTGIVKNWTDLDFQTFVGSLTALVKHLLAPLSEKGLLAAAENLSLAAVAPLALHGSIFQEHEKLSPEDQTRYSEATELMENVKLLVNKINNFISQITEDWKAWKSKTGSQISSLIMSGQK